MEEVQEKIEKKVIGRENLSTTLCILMEDGYWKATSEMHDRVLYEGETEWIDEKIEAMSLDKDSQKAIQTAMNSTLGYLLENVYRNGFNGLVEFREFERQMNASKIESVQNS